MTCRTPFIRPQSLVPGSVLRSPATATPSSPRPATKHNGRLHLRQPFHRHDPVTGAIGLVLILMTL